MQIFSCKQDYRLVKNEYCQRFKHTYSDTAPAAKAANANLFKFFFLFLLFGCHTRRINVEWMITPPFITPTANCGITLTVALAVGFANMYKVQEGRQPAKTCKSILLAVMTSDILS
uniref:Uncharacterized protein n=1 Tax=Glossina brevipalpis TaxID=37001 RepID=A0A1A9W0Y0_9MUSC